MDSLLHASWRVYPAALLMVIGVLLAARSVPWHFAQRTLLDRILRIWRVSIWLALALVGLGWWRSIEWLAGIGLGFFIAEGWESGMVLGGLREREALAPRSPRSKSQAPGRGEEGL